MLQQVLDGSEHVVYSGWVRVFRGQAVPETRLWELVCYLAPVSETSGGRTSLHMRGGTVVPP